MQQNTQKKEDLRVLRTRQKIYRCFLDLRRKKPIEEIRITDLCEKAGINRATFYHHYEDIYALSDEMEYSVIERYQQKLTKEDVEMFFSEPDQFLPRLEDVINSERTDIEILSGGRKAVMYSKMEEKLVDLLMAGEEDERKRITLTYAVGGAIHVIYFYSSGRSYDTELLREMICSMVLRIVKE